MCATLGMGECWTWPEVAVRFPKTQDSIADVESSSISAIHCVRSLDSSPREMYLVLWLPSFWRLCTTYHPPLVKPMWDSVFWQSVAFLSKLLHRDAEKPMRRCARSMQTRLLQDSVTEELRLSEICKPTWCALCWASHAATERFEAALRSQSTASSRGDWCMLYASSTPDMCFVKASWLCSSTICLFSPHTLLSLVPKWQLVKIAPLDSLPVF